MQTIKLNLIPGSVLPVVNVSQYDEKRQFALQVYEGAAPYSLSGKSVEIRGTKPDGNGFAYDAQDGVVSVSGNTVTISTTQQMTAVGGQTMAELRITSGTTILGTINFILDVEHSALSDDTPISETEIPVIERRLEELVEEVQVYTEDAEAWAVGERDGEPVPSSDPTYHNNAKYYASNALSSASTATTKASEAATSATNAGNSATTASNAATTATTKAGEASTSATNAENSATAAAGDSLEAEGFAVGEQNGTPVGPDSPYYHNNAAYYAQEAGQHASGGIIFKGSLAFADLPTVGMASGDEYNITDDFTTDSRFIEGAGLSVKAGTNIAWVAGNVNKWDILATGGGGADALDDLTDVELTSPAEGDLLQRNGNGKWVNSAAVPNALAAVRDNGAVNYAPITYTSRVVSGITFTVAADGQITANMETAPSSNLPGQDVTPTNLQDYLPRDKWLRVTGSPAGGSYGTYGLFVVATINGSTVVYYDYGTGARFKLNSTDTITSLKLMITIRANANVNGFVWKPMISLDRLNLFYDDYQPYSMTNRELTEAVTETSNRLSANIIGESVDLSSYVHPSMYTAPSDGYFVVELTAGQATTAMYAFSATGNNRQVSNILLPGNKLSLFVKKGMRLSRSSATVYSAVFVPLEN